MWVYIHESRIYSGQPAGTLLHCRTRSAVLPALVFCAAVVGNVVRVSRRRRPPSRIDVDRGRELGHVGPDGGRCGRRRLGGERISVT